MQRKTFQKKLIDDDFRKLVLSISSCKHCVVGDKSENSIFCPEHIKAIMKYDEENNIK